MRPIPYQIVFFICTHDLKLAKRCSLSFTNDSPTVMYSEGDVARFREMVCLLPTCRDCGYPKGDDEMHRLNCDTRLRRLPASGLEILSPSSAASSIDKEAAPAEDKGVAIVSVEEEKGAEEGKEDLPAAALISSDSLSLIMQFLCVSPEHFRVASVVCHEWHELLSERAVSNVIWSGLAKRRWVFIPDSTKVRNWLKFYRRRHEAVRATSEADRKSSAHVMNCLEWELNCPIAADKLGPLKKKKGFGSGATQYCSVCKEDVHVVQSARQVAGHLEAGYCMTFDLGRTLRAPRPRPPVRGRMRMPPRPVHARPPRPVPSRPMPGGLPLPPPE
eukprot:PLAT12517.7.p1 GENE.PLAT12517.7~~PLAT12517.7.p1  ORF type:complete len:331 (-),score=21.97 PLAT12517.7:60-1052(-)